MVQSSPLVKTITVPTTSFCLHQADPPSTTIPPRTALTSLRIFLLVLRLDSKFKLPIYKGLSLLKISHRISHKLQLWSSIVTTFTAMRSLLSCLVQLSPMNRQVAFVSTERLKLQFRTISFGHTSPPIQIG